MRYGEIIELGSHRLMCGDATSRDDVMRLVDGVKVDLVLTDPPYGKSIHAGYNRFKGGWLPREKLDRDKERYSQEHYRAIKNDKDTSAMKGHYDIATGLTDKLIVWGGNYFTDILPPLKCWLVWNKEQALPNHANCELAYTSLKAPVKFYRQHWNGCIREGSKNLNPSPSLHLSQKPVELHMKILEDFTQPGDIILDCFGGSGTTLIACEMTGRKCLMMEISPEYCDIIRERYEKLQDFTPLFRDIKEEETCPA